MATLRALEPASDTFVEYTSRSEVPLVVMQGGAWERSDTPSMMTQEREPLGD